MSSGKEYTMLFQLSAQLGGNFSGTFSRAQQTITKMQSDIQALNRTQADVSAYQKQQAAIETTRNKLSVLQQQYDNIQREISETGTFSSDLENKLLSKQQQIDKTNASIQRQTDKLNQMGSALREAGVDTDHLTDESKRLEAEMTELKKKQEDVADGADSFGERSAAAFAAIQQALVAAGIAEGLKEIAEAYMDCVNLAGDFEEAMSAVEAISGADAQGMAELSSMAKELGATTKFTAQQSAEAMSYMAMAGWDVNDMLGGMSGVLSLAAASGEDLAMVSDIVTDSLTAFGLSASDSGHFSDVLAAAAANANTNVSIMGETMKMSASVAGALGYSIEDVAVAMGLMANSGVKGSIAGTALRNTFNGLLSGVTLTGEAFGEYTFSAIRADGTMKGFASTIDELRGYFQQMTEAERVANAQAIAGQRGYNGLLAILNASDAEYQKLTASINGCSGAAERMANIRMDNMKGQLTLLQSSWEALRVTIGENFTDSMRDVYATLTDMTTEINGFLKTNPGLVKAAAAFTTVIGGAAAAVATYAAAAKLAALVTGLLSAEMLAAAAPIVAVVGVGATLAAVLAGLTDYAGDATPKIQELTESTRGLNAAMQEASQTYDDASQQISVSASVADGYIDRLEEIEHATRGHVAENQEYLNTLQLLTITIPELADYIDLETGSIEGGTAALRAHTAAWKRDAEEAAYREYMNSVYASYNDVAVEMAKNQTQLLLATQKLDVANEEHNRTIARMAELEEQATLFGGERLAEYEALKKKDFELRREMRQTQETIDVLNGAISEGSTALAGAGDEIKAIQQAAQEATSAADGTGGAITDTFEKLLTLADAYDTAYQSALESFQGQFSLFETAQADADATVTSTQAALNSQLSYWQSYAANMQTLRAVSYEALGTTEENYAALLTYLNSGSEEAAGLAQSIADNLASGNAAAVGEMANTIGAIKVAQDQAAEDYGEWVSGLTEQSKQMIEEMTAEIEQLDMSDEARSAAESTIQTYIATFSMYTDDVRSAAARIAQAASSGLNSVSLPGGSKNGGSGMIRGKAAIGTQHANRGYYLVGEEGPEIVWMDGGEQVMNARETQRVQESMEAHRKMLESARQNMPEIDWINGGEQMRRTFGAVDARESMARELYQSFAINHALSSAIDARTPHEALDASSNSGEIYAPTNVQVEFRFEGNVTSEAVDRLEEYGDEFAERVRQVMEDVATDQARSGYR